MPDRPRRRLAPRGAVLGAAVIFVMSACTAGSDQASTTTIENYPDSITRTIDRLAREPRPVENSALPPRHLDAERFPETLVERDRIVSGGPPADGIPPIDAPEFSPVDATDWIEPSEPVIVARIDDEVRVYPLQVLIWHEVVNDVVADTPVAVTYCPLCNSGVVYERTIDGEVLDFGTSGSLYQANLVMYDRQTESLWTQFDGRAVVGDRVGDELRSLPTSVVSWSEAIDAHPDALVLQRDTVNPRPYGRNPYVAYESRERPVAGFFTGEADSTLPPFARVVGIELEGEAVAVETSEVAAAGVLELELSGQPLTVWHRAGTSSALDGAELGEGVDVGATGVFVAEVDGRATTFEPAGDGFVDDLTGSMWNLLGEAIDGPRAGERLDQVAHVDTFWFSWAAFQVTPILFDGAT